MAEGDTVDDFMSVKELVDRYWLIYNHYYNQGFHNLELGTKTW